MNRVRIVALSAVVLGGAVVVGTRFQQSGGPVETASAPAPVNSIAAAAPADTGAAPSLPTPSLAAAPGLTTIASAQGPTEPLSPSVEQPVVQPLAPQASQPVSLIASAPQPSNTGPHPGMTQPSLVQASVLPGSATPGTGTGDPELDSASPRTLAANETAPAEPVAPLDPALQAELAACAVWLVVTPAPGAMLETSVYAPCDGGAAITLTHAGLSVDMRLGEDGQLLVQLPALTDQASVTLHFADGREQSDQAQVPDLANVERVAVTWQAPAQLELHAYEFGAGYNDYGHVYWGAPREPSVSDEGFLTVLGDPLIVGAHMAQIYSYPKGESPRTGRVALEIEAPVTDVTCGQPLTANTVELHGIGAAQVRQIRLDMPQCDGQGGYLVLPGVLPELQIALAN